MSLGFKNNPGGKNVIVMYTCKDNLPLAVQWENKKKKNQKKNPFFLCIFPFSLCPYACIFLDHCIKSVHPALYSAFVLAIGDKITNKQNRVLF